MIFKFKRASATPHSLGPPLPTPPLTDVHEHPLAVYGNVAWTTFMTIVAGVPIVDIIVDTEFMCQLAQITSSLCGLFWALC